MHVRRVLRLAAILLFLTTVSAILSAQSVTFDARHYPGTDSRYHADLNNDGREDFVVPSSGGGFDVINSTGDGVYGAAIHYTIPGVGPVSSVAIADFNLDGKADLMVMNATNHAYEFLNNGDGTFHQQADFVLPLTSSAVIAGDFNHDGKVDVVFDQFNSSNNQSSLLVWFSNGDGGFTTGPTSSSPGSGGEWYLGDFDGDGKADLMTEFCTFSCAVEIFYGDGAGHFSAQPMTNGHGAHLIPADVNGDGKSDLIGTVSITSTSSNDIAVRDFYVFYGNSSRTWTEHTVATAGCNAELAVADFNGDGLNDVALHQYADCTGAAPHRIVVMTRNADGSFNPEQTVYTTNNNLFFPEVVRSDRDTRPDIAVAEEISAGNLNLLALLNTTSGGNFPACAPPNAFTGINVCSSTVNVTSPVPFHVGAAGQTPMRKVEVWVDGSKKGEEDFGFSKYSFMDQSIALANGSHHVSVIATGWDNWMERTAFTLTVGSGGGACTAPTTSGGVNICSPTDGSTVSNPVQVTAQGGSSVTAMETWIDGVKKNQTSGPALSFSITLAAGSHRLAVLSKVGTSYTGKQVVNFTVGSGTSGCSAPSNPTGVNVCSPADGSTVGNPVQVTAQGGSSVNEIEAWIDGTKRSQASGNTLSFSTTLSAGTHRLAVLVKSGSSYTAKEVVNFTVQ